MHNSISFNLFQIVFDCAYVVFIFLKYLVCIIYKFLYYLFILVKNYSSN